MTRGERDNNPCNIRLSSIKWLGQIAGSDTAFCTFDTPEHGIRAGAKLLSNYQKDDGLNTVRLIINHYAPPVENDTGAYVNAVAQGMGVPADAEIDLTNLATLEDLVKQVIIHENGECIYSDAQIAEGVSEI